MRTDAIVIKSPNNKNNNGPFRLVMKFGKHNITNLKGDISLCFALSHVLKLWCD